MASLGDLIAKIGVDLSDFSAAMRTIPQQVEGAISETEKKWAGIDKMGSHLVGLGAGMTAAITLPLGAIAASALKVSEDLNTANIAFTTMLGSGEKANAFLQDLQKFAASTPFEFPDLVDAAKRMQAMGFEANQVIPTLRIVGDTVALVGGGSQAIEGITTALARMQTQGKVSAEEMNMLTDRGIKGWEYIAKAAGVTVPEAMKLAEKGAIDAATAVPAILAGMNKEFGGGMETASKTLTGVWSNFKDTVTMALGDIGKVLAPIATSLVTGAMPIIQFAKDAVQWFGQLPTPVQNAGIAIGAIAAGISTLVLAVGGIATAFATALPALTGLSVFLFGAGATAGALIAPVIAIGAVTTALVALGTWVYENWEPIKATVFQAWDGLTEAWGAIWNPIGEWLSGVWSGIGGAASTVWEPIVTFFTKIWDVVGPYMTSAWEGIKGALVGVWNAIQTAASTVWNSITSVFQTFLEWAAKIPGVNKLMNLDEAWNHAKKLKDETEKATTAVKDHGESHKTAAPKVKILNTALGDSKKKLTEVEKAAIRVAKANDDMVKRYEQQAKDYVKDCEKLNKATNDLKQSTIDLKLDYARAHEDMRKQSQDTVKIIVPDTERIPKVLRDTIQANKDLEAAFNTLGINSSKKLNDLATDAKTAYEKIRDSGQASSGDLNKAWVAYEEARINAARAAGVDIPAEDLKMLNKVKEQLTTHTTESTTKWDTWKNQVSTIVTDLGASMAKTLFDGDKSWGEKAKSMLDSLGQAVTRAFVEPATKAIGEFISGALADLMGGKGWGGVLSTIKDAGKATADVFSQSATGATAAGGGGAPISGGGAAAAGAAGGITGLVNMVANVVTAISSIIQNFQLMKIETTLNAIEESTRYVKIWTGEQPQNMLWCLQTSTERLGYLNATADALGKKLDTWLEPLPFKLTQLTEVANFGPPRLDAIGTNTRDTVLAVDRGNMLLADIRDTLRSRVTQVSITISGAASPEATAQAIAAQLRTQGAF